MNIITESHSWFVRCSKLIICASLVLGWADCVRSAVADEPAHFPDVPEARQFVYKTAGDDDLRLWVLSPENSVEGAKLPAIVFFFGGGWRSGSPQQFVPQARYLSSRGMVAVLADYRVSSRQDVKAVDCVQDAKSAVRWIRSHADELGVDPHRICAAGGSAGGHIACCTAVVEEFDADDEDQAVNSRPDALALFNPAVMLAPLEGRQIRDIDPEKLATLEVRMGVSPPRLSPVHLVRPDLPPTLIVHGEADTVVPFSTVEEFTARMKAAGNRCDLIGYPGAPHGFFNWRKTNDRIGSDNLKADNSRHWYGRTLRRLDEFLVSLGWLDGAAKLPHAHSEHLKIRGSLLNSLHRFQVEKKGHVAFLGGSITEMNGYRTRVEHWLKTRFPDTDFTFTNAGIASTCSTTGAFRLERDVLSAGPVDLLLVEFAVNDDQDASHDAAACVRGMEGIIVKTRRHNPLADIVMIHFVNPGMLKLTQTGDEPISARQHERVARHHMVSSVYLCRELADRIESGSFTWDKYGGTHPGPEGNQFAADLVAELLTAAWSPGSVDHNIEPHLASEQPLLQSSYVDGTFLPPDAVEGGAGWTYGIPDWKSLAGSKRGRFANEMLWYADTPAAVASFEFDGTAVGAYVLAGPDAGQMEVSIDDGDWKTIELFHRHSRGLHYPRTVMFATELSPGTHRVRVRVGGEHHQNSSGHAVRVLSFVINR
jgi:acetyl esterase/lipase/lysophospholipase L1-like esterase